MAEVYRNVYQDTELLALLCLLKAGLPTSLDASIIPLPGSSLALCSTHSALRIDLGRYNQRYFGVWALGNQRASDIVDKLGL